MTDLYFLPRKTHLLKQFLFVGLSLVIKRELAVKFAIFPVAKPNLSSPTAITWSWVASAIDDTFIRCALTFFLQSNFSLGFTAFIAPLNTTAKNIVRAYPIFQLFKSKGEAPTI